MSRATRAAFAVAALVLLPAGEPRAERILEFRAEIRVDENGDFNVEERIRYDFEGASRHGIYRDIPVRYGRGAAADYRIGLDIVSVTDASGASRPYRATNRGGYRRIRIGDPNRKVTGVHEYQITYQVRRGLLWLEERDELYWNVTGNEWQVPIDSARVRVETPSGGAEPRALCFTGPRGSVETTCRTEAQGRTTTAVARRRLDKGEGLTLVLALPKGLLREPSAASRALDRAGDYVSWATALPFLLLAGLGAWWWRNGRDPAGAAAIPVRYEPPEGMSPAEMGTVLDERADLADITATILDLAVRGYLRIEETQTTKYLFLSETSYRFHRLHKDEAELKGHEVKLLSSLFGAGDSVAISQLKDSFYERLPAIQGELYQQVSKRSGWFPTAPDRVRFRFNAIVIGLSVAGAMLAFGAGSAAGLVAIAASAAVGLAFARAMPRRTCKGRRARQHIQGFREFVERVEVDRLERLGMRSIEQFEKLLPYAFVLGVADAWADAFSDLYTEPPQWYVGRDDGLFRPGHFVDRVGHSLQTAGSAMSSRPRGSGTSGFSSGGGFSGGGFGGGGGGSW